MSLREEAGRSDRSVDDLDVALYVVVAHRDSAAARRAFREVFGYYDRVSADVEYRETIGAIHSASSTAAAANRVADALLDELGVAGTPSDVESRIVDL